MKSGGLDYLITVDRPTRGREGEEEEEESKEEEEEEE